jgi:predicted Zn finger-like uncharacterized protein
MREIAMAQHMLACPACQGVFQLDESQRGQTLRCQRCQHVFAAPTPVTSGTPWFVARDKVKLGPYSSAQLKELAKTGQLWPEDMVLKEGERKWVAASAIKGLFVMASKTANPAAAAPPAAAPRKPKSPVPEPQSENVFAEMTAGAGTRRNDRAPRANDDDRPRRRDERQPAKKGSGGKVVLFVILGVAVGCTGLCAGSGYWLWTWIDKKRQQLTEFVESAGDNKEYTIKLKSNPDKGKSAVIRESEGSKGTIKIFGGDGKLAQEIKGDETNKLVCRRTVLELANGRPTKYKETYEKAETVEGDKTRPRSLQGRTVLFELKNGKYKLTPAPRGLDDQRLADRPFKQELDAGFTAGKPVKEGDSWDISGDVLAKAFQEQGQLDKNLSKGQAKLAKVYDKEGQKWGTIEFTLNLKFKGLTAGLTFDPPADADLKGALDAPIDGSSTARTMSYKGPFKGKSQFGQGKQKVTQELEMNLTYSEERDAETDAVAEKDGDGGAKKEEAGDGWKLFKSDHGKFSASFPNAPSDKKDTNVRGDVTLTIMAVQQNSGVTFTVAYTDFGKGLGGVDPKTLVNGIADSYGKAVKGKRKDIKVGDHPGIEFDVEQIRQGKTLEMTYRAFIVKERLYQVLVTRTKGKGDPKDFAKFFDSFKLQE